MSNFSEFLKNNNSELNHKSENKKEYSNEDLQDKINKYSSYSSDKLIDEFMKLTTEKKKRGELTDKELEALKQTINPMLNTEQKNTLEKLIDVVKNVK